MGKRKKRNQKHKKTPAFRHVTPKKKSTAWLNILPDDQWFDVPLKTTILQALQQADIDLPGDCGGMGKCGKCKVRVLTSTRLPQADELGDLSDEEIKQGIRLACRTRITKDLTIYIGESEPELDFFQILKIDTVPTISLDPLLVHREVELDISRQKDGRSNVDLLRDELGPEFSSLEMTMSALRSLSGRLKEDLRKGTAVIHHRGHSRKLLAWSTKKITPNYGLVFDLGTSTLVAKLINLDNGRQEAAVSCLNSQSKYGADVISRLQHVEQNKEGLERLHLLLLHDINMLISRLMQIAGLHSTDIMIAVAAGNTTMQHFFLRMDPTGIAQAPFSAVINDGLITRASEAGLVLHPEALLYVMPSKSGYIGGDMISVILASQAAEQDESIILGLDLGTNGEIFLGNSGRMLTCSTAAGPALEGARISSGSIAKAGAIEGARLQDGRLQYKDIGNINPISICGSGLVDLTAILVNCGIINGDGLLGHPAGKNIEALQERIIEREGVYDFLVASAEESYHNKRIYLTQKDVRELQYAKAAIAAGIQILTKEWGIALEEIDYIYLAGALGNYVNKYSAIQIGLLPMIDPERVFSLGNAASAGATMVLLSGSYWNKAKDLARKIEHIELSTRMDFSEHFIANMDFAQENIWEKRNYSRVTGCRHSSPD